MDRNLGATTSTPALGTTQGLRYQFGRKDPFSGSLTYDGVKTILYDVRSSASEVESTNDESVTVAKSINTPNILRLRGGMGISWCETSDMKYLWGNTETDNYYYPSSTIKTIYDPCPVGYKVPPADVLLVLCKGNEKIYGCWATDSEIEKGFYIKNRDKYGTTFYCDNAGVDDTKLIYLPETYYPKWQAGDLYSFGEYWTSAPHWTDNKTRWGYMFTFTCNGSYMLPNNISMVNTASIRCVKE